MKNNLYYIKNELKNLDVNTQILILQQEILSLLEQISLTVIKNINQYKEQVKCKNLN